VSKESLQKKKPFPSPGREEKGIIFKSSGAMACLPCDRDGFFKP